MTRLCAKLVSFYADLTPPNVYIIKKIAPYVNARSVLNEMNTLSGTPYSKPIFNNWIKKDWKVFQFYRLRNIWQILKRLMKIRAVQLMFLRKTNFEILDILCDKHCNRLLSLFFKTTPNWFDIFHIREYIWNNQCCFFASGLCTMAFWFF